MPTGRLAPNMMSRTSGGVGRLESSRVIPRPAPPPIVSLRAVPALVYKNE
jgi:hypothetical protein